MKSANLALLAALLGLAMAALAEDQIRTKTVIAVVDGDSEAETRIELDSDDLGFNLHDMQEGENRSIVDKDGRTILVTREADGFNFEVDGKTFKVPAFHGEHHGPMWVSGDGVEDVDVRVMHDMHARPLHGMDGIMIHSGKPIDEATQQAIKSILESAGHDSEVHFIDREGGPPRIKVIKKKLQVSD